MGQIDAPQVSLENTSITLNRSSGTNSTLLDFFLSRFCYWHPLIRLLQNTAVHTSSCAPRHHCLIHSMARVLRGPRTKGCHQDAQKKVNKCWGWSGVLWKEAWASSVLNELYGAHLQPISIACFPLSATYPSSEPPFQSSVVSAEYKLVLMWN